MATKQKPTTLEEALLEIDALNASLVEAQGVNETLTAQNEDLRSSLKLTRASELPEEAKADYESRLALGVPPEHALECAIKQYQHDVASGKIKAKKK